jgi:hypothetical protein
MSYKRTDGCREMWENNSKLKKNTRGIKTEIKSKKGKK